MIYELKLDINFLNLIVRGLAKLPFEESAQPIQAIQNEVRQQDEKAQKIAAVTHTNTQAPEDGKVWSEYHMEWVDAPQYAATAQANGAAEAQTAQ